MTLTSDLERLPELVEELKESCGSPSILPEGIRDYVEVIAGHYLFITTAFLTANLRWKLDALRAAGMKILRYS